MIDNSHSSDTSPLGAGLFIGNRHTLGAVFILNHKKALELAAPPVGPIADEARRQGGILELDKHNWPWSMMLVR